MNLTRRSLEYPAYVAVALTAVAVAGLLSVFNLPVQLFPDIEQPVARIETNWPGAAPQEVEAEILEPLEEVLSGTPGLEQIESWANSGLAFINLEFSLETDRDRALLELTTRLGRIRPLPADASRPQINFGGGANDNLIYFFVQRLPGAKKPLLEYSSLLHEELRSRLESIPGVASLRFRDAGSFRKQLFIEVDPQAAAAQGIPLTTLAGLLTGTADVSGGFVDVDRRRYTLRYRGKFSPLELEELVVDWRDGAPIHLGDIAQVRVGYQDSLGLSYQNGREALGFVVLRESGANVLATLEKVFAEVERARVELLEPNGLTIEKSFDPSVFIWRAIGLLLANLAIGVALAVGVLWLFVRRLRLTLLIAAAIPVSLLLTFLVLKLFGRSFNVISLAGLAFAVGMVLDAAIVVMENTLRLREEGHSLSKAAYLGANQVSGALVASTATTVAVFLPVLFTPDVEGQLFADLALTIAVAVGASLLAALAILPLAASKWLGTEASASSDERFGIRIVDFIMNLTGGRKRRLGWIGGLIVGSGVVVWAMAPALDYLPPVRRDAVDVSVRLPSVAAAEFVKKDVVAKMVERLQPYIDGEKEPALLNYYVNWWPQFGLALGARAKDQGKVAALVDVMRNEVLVDLPDAQIRFVGQGQLFGRFNGGEGSIAMHVQSSDADVLASAVISARDKIAELYPEVSVRVAPEADASRPELTFFPNDRRLAELGLNRAEIGNVVRMLGNGLWLGEYFDGASRLDIRLRSTPWRYPDELMGTPMATPSGEIVSVSELAEMRREVAPDAIRRYDGRRTMTVSFDPPDGVALDEVLASLRRDVEPGVREVLGGDGSLLYGGDADNLARALRSSLVNGLVALGVLFLLTAGLFRSVRDAALVTVSLPLAAAGGIVALWILNLFTFQPLDLLTLIGFIILLGLVVNNAILLVMRTREGESEGLTREAAVRSALETRLRPILMSTSTSLLGMLPLVLAPGAGSAIYRGMATSIAGGLAVSTVFTLILLPALLSLGRARSERAGASGRHEWVAAAG